REGDPGQREVERARRGRCGGEGLAGRRRRRLRLHHGRQGGERATEGRSAAATARAPGRLRGRSGEGQQAPQRRREVHRRSRRRERADRRRLRAALMRPFTALTAVALAAALLFLTIPVVAIFANTAPGDLLDSLGDPSARDALRLSLETS